MTQGIWEYLQRNPYAIGTEWTTVYLLSVCVITSSLAGSFHRIA